MSLPACQILTLWYWCRPDLQSQSVLIWQAGRETRKSTFLLNGPLTCLLPTCKNPQGWGHAVISLEENFKMYSLCGDKKTTICWSTNLMQITGGPVGVMYVRFHATAALLIKKAMNIHTHIRFKCIPKQFIWSVPYQASHSDVGEQIAMATPLIFWKKQHSNALLTGRQ